MRPSAHAPADLVPGPGGAGRLVLAVVRFVLRGLVRLLYRVQVAGLDHYAQAGDRVLIVANHTSFLDGILLALFLPGELTFVVNTYIARAPWARPFLRFVGVVTLDAARPYSLRSLIRYLERDRKVVIFPEGRITVTGSLMKIYHGSGMIADRSGAVVLPIRLDGAQYTPLSRLRGRVRRRWFPKIRVTILPPARLAMPPRLRGRARRHYAGRMLADIMTEMMFVTSNYRRTLFEALLDARRIHGGAHVAAEDIDRRPLSYNRLIRLALTLGRALARETQRAERVGILLPGAVPTLLACLGLQRYGRVPAMLDYTAAPAALLAACRLAGIRTLYTSTRFVRAANLGATMAELARHVRVVCLEDVRDRIRAWDYLRGWFAGVIGRLAATGAGPDDPAVVFFTVGQGGAPRGVVLSHANLLANREQIAARIDFNDHDVILNPLPLFHAYSFTAGTLLPLLSGMKVFFYPTPVHYRIVAELAYETNATIMFGTDAYLNGYARAAHPYDFYSMRYVFTGVEALREDTRRLWAEKFGVRIFEGYGATEAGAVLAMNTPTDHRPGTVGRFLPGVEYHLQPVAGIEHGGRLAVKGVNIMLGYLRDGGHREPPRTAQGEGWYDTGDVVTLDDDGFVRLRRPPDALHAAAD